MSDGLEVRNGEAMMFSGEDITPWHRKGKVLSGLLKSEDALKAAGLDFIVRKEPVTYNGLDGKPRTYANRFLTVRDIDEKPLGFISKNYHIHQNVDSFNFLNNITDRTDADAVYTSAGSLLGGARTFVVMKLTNQFMVGDRDAHDLYIMAINSHDGKQGFTIVLTPIRAVCRNTVHMGLANAVSRWSVTHKVRLEERVQDARETLDLSFAYEKAFEQEVAEMMEIEITKQKFYKLVDELIKPSPVQHDLYVDEIMNIWETEETVKMGGGEGNAWGAFNAVTFFLDHKSYKDADAKFNSVIGTGNGMGFGEALRPKAHKMLMALG